MKKSTIAVIAAGVGLVAGYVVGFLTKDSVKKAANSIYDKVTDFHDISFNMDDDDNDAELGPNVY